MVIGFYEESLLVKIIEFLTGLRKIKITITEPMYIYGLRAKNSKKFVYIGKTNNPKMRLTHHVLDSMKGVHKNKELGDWIRKRSIKNDLVMEVIAKVNENEVDEMEKRMITHYIKLKHPLVNIRLRGKTA